MAIKHDPKPNGAVSTLLAVLILAGVGYVGYYVISRFVAPAVKSGAAYVSEKIDVLKLRSAVVGSWSSRKGDEHRTYTFLSDGTVTAMLPAGLGTREKWAGTYEITLAGKMILHLTAVKDGTRRIDAEEPCELDSDILRIGSVFFARVTP